MNIGIVHTDLNQCGGAEQLAIATMEALSLLGHRFDITTSSNPSFARLEKVFGERVRSIIPYISRINVVKLPELDNEYDSHLRDRLVINTHGDILPYFEPSFSRNSTITYCHYPVLHEILSGGNETFVDYLRRWRVVPRKVLGNPRAIAEVRRRLQKRYAAMLARTYVVTNSKFSQKAISDLLVDGIAPTVLPPPVNVDDYCDISHSGE